MSAGGYDGPHMSPPYPRYEPRRAQGNMPPSYDRLSNGVPRRRSPSPGPSRRPYDSYVPHRPDATFRDGPNVYRPNNYRPDYSTASNFYSRSPSPDAYVGPPRLPDPEPWDRGSSWRPPPPLDTANAWPERKNLPPSPTASTRGRGLRDEASTRLFEPSDSWKQTHVDRPLRHDHSPSSDRFFNRRGRGSIDRSPDRPMRSDRPPVFIPGGDRYRPGPVSSKRDSFPNGRLEYDSYRPRSDSGNSSQIRREPISPSNSHHRRDSGPFNHARTSSRHDSPRTSRAVSRKASPTPLSANPSAQTPNPDSASWDFVTSVNRETPGRPLSRSSIASTQVSARQSPAAVAASEVPSQQQPIAETSVIDALATVAQEAPKNVAESQSADKQIHANGTADQVSVPPEKEKPAPEVVTAVGNESIPDVSIVPNVISPAVKQSLNTINSPSKPMTEAPHLLPKDLEKTPSLNPVKHEIPLAPVQAALRKSPPPQMVAPIPNGAKFPSISQNPVQIPGATELKQPVPSYMPPPIVKPVDQDMEINIPPTTHSPVVESRSPDIAAPSPTGRDVPTAEEIPPLHEVKTSAEALRIVVMTRMRYDRQTREERVNPVLMANLSIAAPLEAHPTATPETLLDKMFSGQALQAKMNSFISTRPKLASYLQQRATMVDDKIARLREEYIEQQDKWSSSCNSLNDQQKTLALDHEAQHGGRTTRRSTAITDAVRSDFEMEQIIASLGVDDATDPNCLSLRNNARIPDMISVVNGQIDYVFDDTAHLVENPAEYYAPQTGIHDWTDVEKTLFLDKFAAYPKQFGIIADFIPNKTAAQCVDYYYLHKKKFIDFRKVVTQLAPNKRKRRGMGKKKGNGLLVDIAKHDMEVRSSETAAQTPSVVTRAPRGRKTVVPPAEKKAARRNAVQFEDTPTSTPTPEPESRTRRRKPAISSTPLANSVAATPTPEPAPAAVPVVSPEPVSKPPTPPIPSISAPPVIQRIPPPAPIQQEEAPDQDVDMRPAKRVKRTRKIKSAATISDEHLSPGPETDKPLPNTTTNDDSANRSKKDKANPSTWSEEDKSLFLALLSQHGDNFKRIAASMPNKTTIQVSNYYWANAAQLQLETIAASAPKRSPPPEQNDTWTAPPATGSGTPNPDPTQNIAASTSTSRGRPPTPPPPMSSLSHDPNDRVTGPFPASPYSNHSGPYKDSARQSFADSIPSLSAPLFASQDRLPRTHLPLTSQPPMARLGANGQADNRRPSLFSNSAPALRANSYTYPNHRGGNIPSDDSAGRHYGMSSPPAQPKQPYFTPMYPSTAIPPNGRPGYTPPTPVASGSTPTPIIHSPTGMSSPKPPPMNPHAYFPPPPDSAHHTSYYPPPPADYRSHPTWVPPGQQRFFNTDGTTTSYLVNDRRRASGSSDDRSGVRRENPYPMYYPPPPPGSASSRGSYAPRPGSSPPLPAPGYYPGWTPIP